MPTKRLRPTPLLLSLILLVLLWGPVLSQEVTTPGLTMDVSAGFDEFYRSENWAPIQVSLRNEGPLIEGYIEIDTGTSGSSGTTYRLPVVLPTQSQQQAMMYIYAPGFGSELDVDLRRNDGELLLRQTINLRRITSGDLLYGVISPDPGEFSFLESVTGRSSRASIAFLELEGLPETAVAWKALDMLVLNDVDTAELTSAQQTAMRQWVNAGGQLVVTGGSSWQKTSAALQDLLPVTVTGSRSVDDLPQLRTETGFTFRDPGPYLVAESQLTSGALLFFEEDLPILAQQQVGRGHIFFLALDPRFAPLLDWDGHELLWQEVVNRIPAGSAWGQGPSNSFAAVSAVSSLPALALPSIITLLLFLLAYTVIVGPANYLILKRMQRTELAWATIPAIVLIFSAATYITGFQLRGNTTIINQMSVAYSTAGAEVANVHSLIGLYSPRRMNYSLSFGSDALIRPYEQEFGSGNNQSDNGFVTYAGEHRIEDVRVDISDIATFTAESNQPALNISGQGTLNIVENRVELEVEVQNNGEVPLETASVLLGGTAVAVGDLAPGEARTVSQVLRTLSSGSTLTPGGTISIAPPRSSSPLTSNASTILGSSNYFDDRDLYPRFELLQSLESSSFGSSTNFSLGADTIVFLAWSKEPQLPVRIDNTDYNNSSTTLHMVNLPLSQNLVSGNDVTLPLALLDWSVLAQNNVYEPQVEFLSLNRGWVEFEFTPWAEFQELNATGLDLHITAAPGSEGYPLPNISLFNWEVQRWETMVIPDWGEWEITNHAIYIGQNNSVRLRLEDNSSDFGLTIESAYPILSGVTQ